MSNGEAFFLGMVSLIVIAPIISILIDLFRFIIYCPECRRFKWELERKVRDE